MNYKIMIVEDDKGIEDLLCSHMEKYGYETVRIEDFEKVIDSFELNKPHIVLLDINLPKYDGYYWCKKIRQVSNCPIIFISARESQMDQVMAIESGADDYITKPFFYEVVTAKIKSQLRRTYGAYATSTKERIIEFYELTLYPERLELNFKDNSIILTKKEEILLESLLNKYPKVVSREYLLEKLWDDQNFVEENTLNVNVTRLRKRLQQIGIKDAIETVRGVGYRLDITWRNE
ncbi:response regulator transcription factor [Tepidibacter hydrothermalis]|uniref:Stage 0 sporulation protein A homolog n=1 Tax=Tepidibacter hydrothermalis TaxID=3036126 RepID=A0ABY8EE85_9FIRM|nr:response regulator transcription factor [Tepidibacter hydrothermalis]WFD11086.1 response regulator transcription factor [Tepidibacter hydrothermalis]